MHNNDQKLRQARLSTATYSGIISGLPLPTSVLATRNHPGRNGCHHRRSSIYRAYSKAKKIEATNWLFLKFLPSFGSLQW